MSYVILVLTFPLCYIASRSEQGAFLVASALYKWSRGKVGVIFDILGEEAKDEKAAIDAALRYLRLSRHLVKLRQEHPDLQLAISIKLTHLGLKVDQSLAKRLLAVIYKKTQEYNLRLEIDMEGPETLNDILHIVRPLTSIGRDFRVAIPANQSKSFDLIQDLAPLGVALRIVKGAYPGDYTNKNAIEMNFLALAKIAKWYHSDVAYGTHDKELIRKAMAIYPGEVHMLFGVRPFAKKDKVYLPFGGWLTGARFLLRRAKEGIRPNVFLNFIINIPASLLWRLCYAPRTFFR